MKIDREYKKIIEYYFLNYHVYKTSMDGGKSWVMVCKGRKEKTHNLTPTDCKWIEVIDRTIKKFERSEKIHLIKKRFFKREKEVKIFCDLYIDRSTYYLWQHEVYEYAYVVAVSKQLLEVI